MQKKNTWQEWVQSQNANPKKVQRYSRCRVGWICILGRKRFSFEFLIAGMLPSVKLKASVMLKIDGWFRLDFFLGFGLFSGAVLVSGRIHFLK